MAVGLGCCGCDTIAVPVPGLPGPVGPTGPPGSGGGDVTSLNTVIARDPSLIWVGPITRDSNGAATSAAVVWPDGTTGTYTALVLSTTFPGVVDSWQITHGTVTYTQPTVTRDATGLIIVQPAIVETTL